MTEGMTKIVVDLPNHWAAGGESMWATPVGPDLYRLENVPFHAYDLNYHDVVEAVSPAPDRKPEVVRVVERSGHRTLRVVFSLSREEQLPYLKRLRELGCELERSNDHLLAIDIPPDVDYDAIVAQLTEWAPEDQLDFETCEAQVEGSFDAAPDEESNER